MGEAAREVTCDCGCKWERPCVRASRAGGAQTREGLRRVSPKGVTTQLNGAWGRNQKTARQKCMFGKAPLDAWKIGGGSRSRDIAATRQEMVVPGADEWSWDQERRER